MLRNLKLIEGQEDVKERNRKRNIEIKNNSMIKRDSHNQADVEGDKKRQYNGKDTQKQEYIK